jgi:hypothetical protein
MKKRILAGVLWFLAVAYLWNLVAFAMGVAELPGLAFGAVVGLLFAIDPLGRIWTRDQAARQPLATPA